MCVHRASQKQTSCGNPSYRHAKQVQEQEWDEMRCGYTTRALPPVLFGENDLLSALALAENLERQ